MLKPPPYFSVYQKRKLLEAIAEATKNLGRQKPIKAKPTLEDRVAALESRVAELEKQVDPREF